MFELLDDLTELVYVCDMETHELLYANRPLRQAFHLTGSLAGKTCHQTLHGLHTPCDFCTNRLLREGEVYTWEHVNDISGRNYRLYDGMFDWQGRRVRMEVAFDTADQTRKNTQLQSALQLEKMMMDCVRELHRADSLAQGVNSMLHLLGEHLRAQRAYIFKLENGTMSNTYEWCSPGTVPELKSLQNLDEHLADRWKACFLRGECVMIENLEDIKEKFPAEYENLHRQNICRLVAVPLEKDGKITGFLGVDNPAQELIHNIAPLLTTLSYFISSVMLRIQDEEKLTQLSFSDSLTGLYNRNRYLRDLEGLKKKTGPLGIVFLDLNGLKVINDRGGHMMGDRALRTCADHLRAAFPHSSCYRIGGDEFVALCPNMKQEDFSDSVSRMQQLFTADSLCQVALGHCWEAQTRGLNRMVQQADAEMYEDKRRFYSREGSIAQPPPLLAEYNMLMSALNVSVSKHLLRPDCHLLWANERFYTLMGYTPEEFEATCHGDISLLFREETEQYETLTAAIRSAYEAGKPNYTFLIQIPLKNHKRLWINLNGTFTEERVEGFPVVYTVFTDVDHLIRSQQEQAVTSENLPGFIARLQVGKEGLVFLSGNERFYTYFGEPRHKKSAGLLFQHNLSLNEDTIHEKWDKLIAGQPMSMEVHALNICGETMYFQVFGDCVERPPEGPVYLCSFLDITELTQQRVQLQKLAFTDPVTGGRNRTSFEMDAGGAVSTAPPGYYALVSLDIQKFKVINDLFGIDAGDKTLRYVFHKLESGLADDEYVARVSADTFNLLLHHSGPEELEHRLQTMTEDVNEYNHELDHKYLLLFSAGICVIDEPELSMTQLQDRATAARKQVSERGGRDYCTCRFFSTRDWLHIAEEKSIENRMLDALQSKQFLVYLQPKQDLHTGQVNGAEALVRWNDPQFGLIPPGRFIPLFEKNGFVVEVDLFVFETVCATLRKWLDAGLTPVTVSVNLSRAHLSHPNFWRTYEEIREKYHVPPSLLEIELTETLVFENPRLLSEIIDEIRRCGYRCSMDDFGSGYSSLNLLKSIRVDILKLDKAFFDGSELEGPRGSAIVDVVVELARRLDMETVAEGVETTEQAAFLRQAGCHTLQGFLFSRPLPIPKFEHFLYGREIASLPH